MKSAVFKNKMHIKTNKQVTLIIKAFTSAKLLCCPGSLPTLSVGECQAWQFRNYQPTFWVPNIKVHILLHTTPGAVSPNVHRGHQLIHAPFLGLSPHPVPFTLLHPLWFLGPAPWSKTNTCSLPQGTSNQDQLTKVQEFVISYVRNDVAVLTYQYAKYVVIHEMLMW